MDLITVGTSRTWRWFQTRLEGLLSRPPGWRPDGTPIPSTRLGLALNPPPESRKR